MKSVGLLTFHSAYNFGSVLQAFATSCAIDAVMGRPACEIVNYRTDEQKAYYNRLYRTTYGVKTFLKDANQAPNHMKRIRRAAAFESFINNYLPVSQEYDSPQKVYSHWNNYDIAVSGSDQIWNRHALELEHAPSDYIEPYFLKGFTGKKISYASSVGNMSIEELKLFKPYLEQYDSLSTRERRAAEMIEEVVGSRVEVVPDPTLLLDADDWSLLLDADYSQDYEDCLVYYSLAGIKTVSRLLPAVKEHSKKLGLDRVLVITPFARVATIDSAIQMRPEFGPLDFLSTMRGSGGVVTDSFHGTMFSIVFGKRFISLGRGSSVDYRKTEALSRMNMTACSLTMDEFLAGGYSLDGRSDDSGKMLTEARQRGMSFLKRSLVD